MVDTELKCSAQSTRLRTCTVLSSLALTLYGIKKPVVPVSYREKIWVGRSEIYFFLNIFFMVLAVFFAGRFAVESRHQY